MTGAARHSLVYSSPLPIPMPSIQLEVDNADGLLAVGVRPSLNWPEPERKPPAGRGVKRL